MTFKSTFLNPIGWENIALKFYNCSKNVENLTLNCYFEGLNPAMELKRSSKETLDYMAHLTWIRVLKSNCSENLS